MIQQAVTGSVTGVFNVAGDGALTIAEIAALLEKPVLTIPEPVLRAALAVGSRLGLTPYGPEQTMFLQYRPVLDNDPAQGRSSATPRRDTSREAFDEWRRSRRSY